MNRRYGWNYEQEPAHDRNAPLLCLAPVKLPAAMDLRAGFPVCWDQGQEGSCTAHGTLGGLVYDQLKQALTVMNPPSRAFQYWCSRQLEHQTTEDSGSTVADALKALSRFGYLPEAAWPYTAANLYAPPSHEVYAEAAQNAGATSHTVPRSQLWNTLASGFPVVMGFVVFSSFESPQVAATGVAPMPGPHDQVVGGHCVDLVGYDDHAETWLLRNSWGTGWGLPTARGYFTLPYAYLADSTLASSFRVVTHVPG
jgi:C1A family cysteine protease